MRLKDINFDKIRKNLITAEDEACRIRKNLGLPCLPITQSQLNQAIIAELKRMSFEVVYTNKLHNVQINGKEYGHIPSITIFKHQHEKEQGGRIFIYDRYSDKKKRELLMHEFIHIKDTLVPTWSTDTTNMYTGMMLSIDLLKRVELTTDLTALTLMMPFGQFQGELFTCSYDINQIVRKYEDIETNTVIEWIMLHDYFHAHYALLYTKGVKFWVLDEYSNTNNAFDMSNILHNSGSVAYQSRSTQSAQNGDSIIDGIEYQCFCFYEKDVEQPLPSNESSLERILTCDRMAVIGWSKYTYKFIKRLEFK